MAELQAGDVAGSEASKSEGQALPIVGTSEKVSIVIHDTMSSNLNINLQDKLKKLRAAAREGERAPATSYPKIQKVPFTMRDNEKFQKHYEPRVVAIGPIHHANPNPKFQYSEKLKLRLAGSFIKEHGIGDQDLCILIKNQVPALKNCYHEDVVKSYNEDDLAWMFLVDGCAMLHFIHCVNNGEERLKKLNMKVDHIAFAQRDMFLLENQLPYRLLTLLISSIPDLPGRNQVEESIQAFIQTMSSRKTLPPVQEEDPLHLLQLLWKDLTFPPTDNPGCIQTFRKKFRRVRGQILLGIKVMRSKMCCSKDVNPRSTHTFRSVSELKSSGIKVVKSETCSFKDVSFNQGCLMGTLRLPPIVVDDSAAVKFLNLIAFEMCPDFMNESVVTPYMFFLDSLIDHAADVKELRKAKILDNILGSDEEVAKLFNEIGTDLVSDRKLYREVNEKIEDHYQSVVTAWVAEGLHNHFATPWTFLAFLGATLALVLSSIQAWFSMHPAR